MYVEKHHSIGDVTYEITGVAREDAMDSGGRRMFLELQRSQGFSLSRFSRALFRI